MCAAWACVGRGKSNAALLKLLRILTRTGLPAILYQQDRRISSSSGRAEGGRG